MQSCWTSHTQTISSGLMRPFFISMELYRHNTITQNPHVYIERDTQKKAGMMLWVGLIKDNIIGPFFFDSSVTGNVYLNLLKRSVWPALRALMGDAIDLVYFQQDGASAHYSKVVRRWLDHTFKERWMGRAGPIPWPARSPDIWTFGCGAILGIKSTDNSWTH